MLRSPSIICISFQLKFNELSVGTYILHDFLMDGRILNINFFVFCDFIADNNFKCGKNNIILTLVLVKVSILFSK